MLTDHYRLRSTKRRALEAFRQMADSPYEIVIVTTAALPWMTGTAVNALLRASSLAAIGKRVRLCVPWIHPVEQAQIFAKGVCSTPAEQEAKMREWLAKHDTGGGSSGGGVAARAPFEICFYPARYDEARGSILPLGDTTRWAGGADLCVLEEPEHLNWYHPGVNWRVKYKMVVGVAHTNYMSYAKMYRPAHEQAVVRIINQVCCRAFCDRTIKLSDTLQVLARSSVCNVHGVRAEFLAEPPAAAAAAAEGADAAPFSRGVYFIGKVLWAKGYRVLIENLAKQVGDGEATTPVDCYGSGEDLEQVQATATAAGIDLRFCGRMDHADPSLRAYKVFVNPSRTEVLSTTTAEALAMGKFVVIQRHPSNEFFYRFGNALTYETADEFLTALTTALGSTPAPLTPEERHALSWEGATERFLGEVARCAALARPQSLVDQLVRGGHHSLGRWKGYLGDFIRLRLFDSGPISKQRWLHCERRYREAVARGGTASVVEIVDKSLQVMPPPSADEARAKYERANPGLASSERLAG